mmetsp:Transcript_53142/g.84813  ORF Transcript_53142/g.84813 Transcript_53142/m.84813 type:complete len:592 (-) Transcript_53142:682-2457(-)
MSIIKEGWTEKCGPKRCPTWNKRWLVLYDTRVLEYFKTDSKTDLKGVIELSGKETIKLEGEAGKTFEHGFYLETPTRTYKFAVSSSHEKHEWCKLIKQVMNGQLRIGGQAKIKTKKRTISGVPEKMPTHFFKPRAQSSPMKPKSSFYTSSSRSQHMELKEMEADHNSHDDDDDEEEDAYEQDDNAAMDDEQKHSEERAAANQHVKLFTLDEGHNHGIVLRVIDFLYMDKYEFAKLFVICKLFREICINHGYLFRYYTIHVYPAHILSRYSEVRDASHPWILNHYYRQIWIFGNVEHFKYNSKRLKLKSYFGPICNKLFLDDACLWDSKQQQIHDMTRFIKYIARNIRDVHIRTYGVSAHAVSMHDEEHTLHHQHQLIANLPTLAMVDSVRLDFTFHRDLFSKQCINPHNIIYFELHCVDLISDENIDDISLRVLFKQLTKCLVLVIEDSRWKHSIVLPPQIKFFKFKPSDLSIVDMSRIADKSDTFHNLPYKVNWPCDLLIHHINWPSVMNQYIMAGHEALQNKKLRIWVLRHLRKWDKVLMNVNYCQYAPQLDIFKKAKCFKNLGKLDQTRDMSAIWTSKKSKYWRQESL